jgi:hypothetical protein
MLLIRLCLRWLTWQPPAMPAMSGLDVGSSAVRTTPARHHPPGLALIHAPPPLLPLS